MYAAYKRKRKISDSHRVSTFIAYISSRRLLLSLADAGGRIMYAYKDLLELAGLTSRLYTLLSALHHLPPLSAGQDADSSFELNHVDIRVPTAAPSHIATEAESGQDEEADRNDRRADVNPPLVWDLSFVVNEGEHLMITGSNGVGKTAVARVLAGLWAPHGPLAQVKRPAPHPPSSRLQKNVYIVPQRSYMVTGSLLDQMIYPHSYAEFLKTGMTEGDLVKILETVSLKYLPEREGGWLTRKEWRDVLSGGEKQRVTEARFCCDGCL
jgi:ATP-binding cassette subfamily D (ALD) long-chain fatty acid import protein